MSILSIREARVHVVDLLHKARHGPLESPPDDERDGDEVTLDCDGLDHHENIPEKTEKKEPLDGFADRRTEMSTSMTLPIPCASR